MIGLAPKKSELRKIKENESKSELSDSNSKSKNSPFRLWACLIGAILLFVIFSLNTSNFNDYISAAIYAISIVLPVFIITDRGLTSIEKMRIGVIYIIAVFVIFFWSAFEQAGSSLTIFADKQCDRWI